MTKIEWTKRPGTVGVSWNPLRARNKETGGVGHFCEKVSAGCKNCYAETFQKRFRNPVRYAAQDADQVEVFLDEKTLLEPLKWRKRRTVFVCSQTDLFLRHYTDEMICKVFAVMALQKPDTFIVLTKRPERANAFLRSAETQEKIGQIMRKIYPRATCYECPDQDGIWPLSNVWVGVSIEDQKTASERIPLLLGTPADKRFVSAEPLLGPINIEPFITPAWDGDIRKAKPANIVNWVICGGESGNRANPMHPDWARGLRDQCAKTGTPFFFKQWGAWKATYDRDHDDPDWRNTPKAKGNHQRFVNLEGGQVFHGDRVVFMERTSKAKNGSTLDGIKHNAFPGDAA